MLDVIGSVIRVILLAFGIELNFNVSFTRLLYISSGPIIIVLLYVVAWNRVGYYSNLMDKLLLELWTKEEFEAHEGGVSGTITKMRLKKLKEDYGRKIEQARRRRDFLFKAIPLVKWHYKWKKGKNAPMYTLPD